MEEGYEDTIPFLHILNDNEYTHLTIRCLGRFASLFSWGVVMVLHQARPTADLIAPLTIGHLAIATNGKLAVDVRQTAVLLRA